MYAEALLNVKFIKCESSQYWSPLFKLYFWSNLTMTQEQFKVSIYYYCNNVKSDEFVLRFMTVL